jgi:plastocyanin
MLIASLLTALLADEPEPHRPPVALAATAWEVLAPEATPDGQFGALAFFPDPLTVLVGDSVQWTVEGAHTVTFLGEGGTAAGLPQFVAGGPIPGGRMAGPGFFPAGPEGPYDGGGVRSSGRPAARGGEPYKLTFTAAGVFPYLCLVHPGMNGSVTVVPEGAALAETPAQARARGDAEREALLAGIRAGAQAVRTASAAAGGTRAHGVAAGLSNGSGGSALQFVPGDLAVRRGDLVVWMLADPLEPHTITFLSGEPAPEFAEVLPQPDGTVLVVQRPEVFGPAGGSTYTGQGYLNSGQLLGGARGPIAFAAQIDAPAGTYAYQCLIHREMKAALTVTE